MQISKRMTGITGTGTDGWEIFTKARDMIEAGTDVIELTVGQHDISTDPAILDAMHASAKAGNTGYSELPGSNALRDQVAAHVQSTTGVPTSRHNVLITPGAQFSLFAGLMGALDPGDKALYIDPYYATYPGTIRAAGGKDVTVPAHASANFQPKREDLDAQAQGARALLINSPNNPTGVTYSTQTHEMIADFCKLNDLWLLSDEVYEAQIWDGKHLSPRALPGMAERTLVTSSMSKSYAMTGSRVGWLVAPEPFIEQAIDLATHTTYGVSGFLQDAALFALRQDADFVRRLAEPFERRLGIANRLLAGQNIVRAVPSSATMYIMLDVRATGLSGEDFARALLDQAHIAVMPGESFGIQAAGHLRVAMTVDDARFEHAFRALLDFAKEQANG